MRPAPRAPKSLRHKGLRQSAESTLVERGRVLSAFLAALGADVALKLHLLLAPHPELQRAV